MTTRRSVRAPLTWASAVLACTALALVVSGGALARAQAMSGATSVTLPPVAVPVLPPMTVPPVTLPPVTLPAVTVPAVTVPAVTVPPVTLPTTIPPVTAPPVTVPPVTVPTTVTGGVPQPPGGSTATTGSGAATGPATGPETRPGGPAGPSGRTGHPRSRRDAGFSSADAVVSSPNLKKSSLPVAIANSLRSFVPAVALVMLIAAFLCAEAAFDRRDPKLARSPLDQDDETLPFS